MGFGGFEGFALLGVRIPGVALSGICKEFYKIPCFFINELQF